MKKIEKLTPAQEQNLIDFRQKWLDVGLCCEPANFEKAEEQISFFYEKLGKKKPMFFRFSSPLMCEIGYAALKIIFDKKFLKESQLESQLWSQLRSQLESQLGSQLGSQYNFYYNSLSGQHNSAWIAFYKFGLEIGAKYKDDDIKLLNAWGAISENACWWAPYEGVCIICDRPRFVSFDDERRLHNETKMAVEFSDGWGVYAWHGTRIPEEWIKDKKSLTAKTALTWENIEQRRCACEIVTWARILDELKAKIIDTDDDEQIGELVEVEIPDIGKEKFLRVICGTKRKFAIPMPPHVKTAIEGNAWSYGIDGDTLKKLEVRT